MIISSKAGKDIKPLQMPNSILGLGLGLGVLADLLWVSGGPTGPGFLIWVALFALAAFWIVQRTKASRPEEVIVWSIVGLACALILIFRTTPIVVISMGLVMMVAAAMTTMQKNDKSLRDTSVADHLRSLFKIPSTCLLAAFSVLGKADIGSSILDPRFRTFCRGLLLASPLLALFTLLFSSADAAFNAFASRALNIFSPASLEHLLFILGFSWIATGLLGGVSKKHFRIDRQPKDLLPLGTEDTAAFLGVLTTLFIVFIYLQLGYLFGGRETIEATPGLTLAEYARRGFFEILVVAGITLAVLIYISETNCNKRVFRPLARLLVICLMIILASAGQRMGLYIAEFGLSIDRITAIAGMVWLAIGLLLFTFTVLQGRTKDFAAGLTIAAVVTAFSLALINPAATVARINITRAANNNTEVDAGYLTSLGSDAVPTLLSKIDLLSPYTRCVVANSTLAQWHENGSISGSSQHNWRWWNASRAAAQNAVMKESERLNSIVASCF